MSKILPVITLYQPWASWIIQGWKTIETREHDKFKGLKGKRILIHAGIHTDTSLAAKENPYLLKNPWSWSIEMPNGFILGSAFVRDFRLLTPKDAECALIECETTRYGLFLEDVEVWTPVPEKGSMGIWYYDVTQMRKVKLNH